MDATTAIDSRRTADALKRARGARTQDEVAREMGVTKQYVSRLENAREDFTERVMQKIKRAFPDFVPVQVTVTGNNNQHVGGQATSPQAEAVMEQATRTLEHANRTLEMANGFLQIARDMIAGNQSTK